MQAAERGREARAAAAAAAEAAADVYIHEVVAGIVADAIELVMVAAPGEQGEAKAVKPGDTKPGLSPRMLKAAVLGAPQLVVLGATRLPTLST